MVIVAADSKHLASMSQKVHIILVHGACHGAWCWYKLKPLLELTGHRVTAVDLAAAGVDSRRIRELQSFTDYTRPLLELMDSIPPAEKVALVGHSLGGLSISLAMEMFPEKIHVAVFLTAFMPDLVHPPTYWVNKLMEETPKEVFMDTAFSSVETAQGELRTVLFGPSYISSGLYSLSPPEDVELAKTLVRPCGLFGMEQEQEQVSKEGFGSVRRVYVLCEEDKALPATFQRLLVDKCGVEEVKGMEGTDHMAMISRPHQLCQHLLDIINK